LRILCDFLTVEGFLTKSGDRYQPSSSARVFLDRGSPAYIGSAIDFVASPEMIGQFLDDPTAFVRKGGSAGLANLSADNPIWVKFAKGMGAFTGQSARSLAAEIAGWPVAPGKVLDIASGPGRFGIEIAKILPAAQITALDWRAVLDLSEDNARQAGVGSRYRGIAGSAFEVDWGGNYDLILLPNFLHHFDAQTCIGLMKKIKASLAKGGRVVAVEFVPDENRVSPPFPATFAFQMLANTPAGEAYTRAELEDMGRQAGFTGITFKPLAPSPATLIFFEMPSG
jgi:SAM-dependent methyltransferase